MRRVAGGKARSVFALTHQIDAWLGGHPGDGRESEAFTAPRARWLRLASAFTNARDGAMLAIADADRALSQAPGSEGTPYQCTTCPADPPVFYATFPRSELNILTASRFNRAQVAWVADHLFLTTMEVEGDPIAGTALYEFGRDLRLVRARYGDLYWDLHRRLEREGRLTHSRENCPDRNGPPAIEIWSGIEWKRLPASR